MIQVDQDLLNSLLAQAKENSRLRMNMDMRTSSADTSQRMLNALLPGTEVPIHRHEETSESVICLCGKLYEIIYEESVAKETIFKEVDRILLCPAEGKYGCQVPKGAWHTIEVLEPSVIFEAKDGAYK
ncbi:WbuC family cupin fold metalloprotein [uncultured Bacteroides sp.]|uniref:WbuC family cupin fold metalloprotein n=1 Tax=uncultured Bacteroides sp. TaxID=162156 RepID=UPI00374A3FD6